MIPSESAGPTPIGTLEDEFAVLRTVIRDLAPRKIGGFDKQGRRQVFCVHRMLTPEQWAAIDDAVAKAPPRPATPDGQTRLDIEATP